MIKQHEMMQHLMMLAVDNYWQFGMNTNATLPHLKTSEQVQEQEEIKLREQ